VFSKDPTRPSLDIDESLGLASVLPRSQISFVVYIFYTSAVGA
jgi:hypothetical protein